MKITVTKEDILKGERADHQSCPVALAVKRQTGYPYVSVAGFEVVCGDSGWDAWGAIKNVMYDGGIPPKVESFIDTFDGGKIAKKDFKPFTFNLPGLTKYQKEKHNATEVTKRPRNQGRHQSQRTKPHRRKEMVAAH